MSPVKSVTNINDQRKSWFVYKPIKGQFPQVKEEPCTFEEALQKAWELQQMINGVRGK